MLAKLEYNLPEEQEEFDVAHNGWKYKLVLFEFDSSLRDKLKYNEVLTDEEFSLCEKLRKELHDLLTEQNLTLM